MNEEVSLGVDGVQEREESVEEEQTDEVDLEKALELLCQQPDDDFEVDDADEDDDADEEEKDDDDDEVDEDDGVEQASGGGIKRMKSKKVTDDKRRLRAKDQEEKAKLSCRPIRARVEFEALTSTDWQEEFSGERQSPETNADFGEVYNELRRRLEGEEELLKVFDRWQSEIPQSLWRLNTQQVAIPTRSLMRRFDFVGKLLQPDYACWSEIPFQELCAKVSPRGTAMIRRFPDAQPYLANYSDELREHGPQIVAAWKRRVELMRDQSLRMRSQGRYSLHASIQARPGAFGEMMGFMLVVEFVRHIRIMCN